MSPAFKHQQRNLEMNFSAYFAVNTADSEIANRWGGGGAHTNLESLPLGHGENLVLMLTSVKFATV